MGSPTYDDVFEYLVSGSSLERSIGKQYLHQLPEDSGSPRHLNAQDAIADVEEQQQQTNETESPVQQTNTAELRPAARLAITPLPSDTAALSRRRIRAAAAYRRKNPHLFCVRKIVRNRLKVAAEDVNLDNAAPSFAIKKVGKTVTKSLQGLALHVEEELLSRINALLMARTRSGGTNTISIADVLDSMALLLPEALYPFAETHVKQTLEKLKEASSKETDAD